jgi:hydrogenase maturation protein HypF
VKEPRRSALALLFEIYGEGAWERTDLPAVAAFSLVELAVLKTMLARGVNSVPTTSAGRLFDAVASLLNLRQRAGFEGQAAMDLEFALEGIHTNAFYPFSLSTTAPSIINWSPMIQAILDERGRGISVGEISAKFHNTLVESLVHVARIVGEKEVALSGGCFQNRYLTERTIARLREEGFRPHWHQRVPTNDGGISLGQIVAAKRELRDTDVASNAASHLLALPGV